MNLNQKEFNPEDLLISDGDDTIDLFNSTDFEYEEETEDILIIEVMEELAEEYEFEKRSLYFQNKKYNEAYRNYYEIEAKFKKLFYEPVNLHSLLKNPYLAYKGFKKLYEKLINKKSKYNNMLNEHKSQESYTNKLLEARQEHIKIISEQEERLKEQEERLKEQEEREINIDTKFYTQTIRRQAQTIQYLQNELNKYRH